MFASTVPLPSPGTLQEVTVPIVSTSTCLAAYSTLTDNMLCAGLSEGGRDSCQVSEVKVDNSFLWGQEDRRMAERLHLLII